MNKVSFICTTYRRFHCVERIIAQYLSQDYTGESELIIFNTDTDHPMSLDDSLSGYNILVFNNGIDYISGELYTNRGAICRDAVTHASGDYFMLADDDDYYLPWHLRQAVDGILENEKDAWKPMMSFFKLPHRLEIVRNTLEASVIVKMHRIREIGFRTDITALEGLSWYTQLRDEKHLDEYNKKYVPSYCFNWSDPHEIAGHKQSGDVGHPNNFDNHKEQSVDYAKRPLKMYDSIQDNYAPFYEYYRKNRKDFDSELMSKYVEAYL